MEQPFEPEIVELMTPEKFQAKLLVAFQNYRTERKPASLRTKTELAPMPPAKEVLNEAKQSPGKVASDLWSRFSTTVKNSASDLSEHLATHNTTTKLFEEHMQLILSKPSSRLKKMTDLAILFHGLLQLLANETHSINLISLLIDVDAQLWSSKGPKGGAIKNDRHDFIQRFQTQITNAALLFKNNGFSKKLAVWEQVYECVEPDQDSLEFNNDRTNVSVAWPSAWMGDAYAHLSTQNQNVDHDDNDSSDPGSARPQEDEQAAENQAVPMLFSPVTFQQSLLQFFYTYRRGNLPKSLKPLINVPEFDRPNEIIASLKSTPKTTASKLLDAATLWAKDTTSRALEHVTRPHTAVTKFIELEMESILRQEGSAIKKMADLCILFYGLCKYISTEKSDELQQFLTAMKKCFWSLVPKNEMFLRKAPVSGQKIDDRLGQIQYEEQTLFEIKYQVQIENAAGLIARNSSVIKQRNNNHNNNQTSSGNNVESFSYHSTEPDAGHEFDQPIAWMGETYDNFLRTLDECYYTYQGGIDAIGDPYEIKATDDPHNKTLYHHVFEVNEEGYITQPEILHSAAEGLVPYQPENDERYSCCYMDFYRGSFYIKNFEWKNKRADMMKAISGQKLPVIDLKGQSQEAFRDCTNAFVMTIQKISEPDRVLLKKYLLRHGGQHTTHIAACSTVDLFKVLPAEAGYRHVCWGLSNSGEHLEAEIIYNAISIIKSEDNNVYILDAETEQCMDIRFDNQKSLAPILTIKLRIRLKVQDNAVCPKITHYEIISYAKDLPVNLEHIQIDRLYDSTRRIN